jgi:hypothetical protein
LQRVLPGISTEQLRSRLNRMVADGMLTRKRYREVPPRVDYELTERAYELMPILGALARWGYDWAWGSPREGESIDIGAIFRLAPGLVKAGAAGGTLAVTVTEAGEDAETWSCTVKFADSGVRVKEREAEPVADARVTGTEASWIRAFSPPGDRSGLKVTGDGRLVEHLLDDLARSDALKHAARNVA